MANLNWGSTTPQNLCHPSGNDSGMGGPTKAAGAVRIAVRNPKPPQINALAKAKADLAAGRINRQQFDRIVAAQSTSTGSAGGV